MILSIENYSDVVNLFKNIELNNFKIFFAKNLIDIVSGNLTLFEQNFTSSVNKSQMQNINISNSKTESSAACFIQDKWKMINTQEHAKRALQIGLSGRHHMFFAGPKGVGKSSIIEFSKYLLPNLEQNEMIEVLNLHPGSNDDSSTFILRPFRSPHSSISAGSMLGSSRSYGEITYAHNGILFLDEFSEFNRAVIESLRQPLEHQYIEISRVDRKIKAKANFILIAASNLCRCGGFGKTDHQCKCSSLDREKYFAKISGPVLDRIDVQVVLDDIQKD
jgi:magnesium chelatase family protein